jgi:hypothetical protein
MQQAKLDSEFDEVEMIIKGTPPSLPWEVIHLRYPRQKKTSSSLQIEWVVFGKLKLPKLLFQQKRVASQEASINYDLLCSQIEFLLNHYHQQGYDLFSMTSTASGFSSMTQLPTQRPSYLFKPHAPKSILCSEEVLILLFKKKEASSSLRSKESSSD